MPRPPWKSVVTTCGLGHSRIETTARYLKPSPEAAANGLSAWLADD
ncbi:MAG: hypothetical protein KKA73_14710 [Chloroflexi bacterium]|nr:hypothetical protein [Chloroflexota bacterium]MBU1748937.1 hypothetical protein [Chloroflexota bacterium]